MGSLWQDVRYALRMLRKSPSFTAVAVLTLALGIGATTAIFSIVNGVLLQPLPYPKPEQLVVVARTEARFDHPLPVSGLNFLDWRARATQFQSLAGFDGRGFTITLGNNPEHELGAAVSSSFLSVLRVRPALGRDFSEAEEHTGHARVALVTNTFWKQSLGADPSWIGRTLTINEQPFEIVGVLPAGFRYALMPTAEIFIPLNLDRATRGTNFMSVIGRLKPDVSIRQAQSEMDSIAGALAKEYPKEDAVQGAVIIPMLSYVGANIRPLLLTLLSAVGLVLLIACANLGNLVLAQGMRRHREMAVRSTLGAGAYRLFRQSLTESLLLGLLGGSLGTLLGYFGLQAFRVLSPGNVPRLDEVRINVHVLAFSSGLSLLAAILFGLVPAFRVSRTNLAEELKEGSARASSGEARSLARQALVVVEIAFSLVLLAGAGLAIRSFLKLIFTDPGYDSRNLLTFLFSPPQQMRKAAPVAEFYRQMVGKMNSIPGVVSVAMSKSFPPNGGEIDGPVITSEHPDMDPNLAPNIIYNPISADYFQTMHVPLLAGREFSEADTRDAAPAVILSETAARSLFPGEDAIGRQVKLGMDNFEVWWTVVGVVAEEHYFGWRGDRLFMAYMPVWQALEDAAPDYDAAMIIRTNANPLSLLPAVRSAVASIDNQMVPVAPETMEQRLGRSFAPRRFNMALLATFAGLALLLAGVGIYGVMAQLVTQRTHEFGIRVALGARPLDVLQLVLGQGLRLALIGAAIGTAIAAGATRLIRSLLYGIGASDPVAFAAAALLLIGVVLLACYIPARRATRVDPITALRNE